MRIFFITTKINFTTAGGSVPDLDQKARILGELGNEVTVITAFSNANSGHENVPYRVIEEQIPARDLLGIQRGILKILRRYENDADIFYIDGQVFLYGAGWYRLTGGRTPVVAFFNRELVCWPENISIFTERLSLLARCKKRLRAWLERRIGMPIASKIDLLTFTSPMLEKAYTDFGLRKDPRAFF
ncbi:MAG: Glycos transf 1 protein, partial [Candidatus Magasanikbacteria bacterium]|nr:Glycos transf 1 protein [Candidatus Magasanikbacteria bacterium]